MLTCQHNWFLSIFLPTVARGGRLSSGAERGVTDMPDTPETFGTSSGEAGPAAGKGCSGVKP